MTIIPTKGNKVFVFPYVWNDLFSDRVRALVYVAFCLGHQEA